jgi:hypothetical protein
MILFLTLELYFKMKTKDNEVRPTGGCLVWIVLFIGLLFSCSPARHFWSRKYPHENTRSIRAKSGLMILQNTYLGRNKYFYSPHNTRIRKHKLHNK